MIRIYLGLDATGKRRYHNKLFRGTKTQAQLWLNEALVRIARGEPLEAAPISVDEYLSKWLAEAAKKRLRERTHKGYEDLLRRHVRPIIGKQRLSDVTALDLQGLYNQMTESGLSARTVRYVHAILSSAFKQALKWGILEKDITRLVNLPKQQRQEMRVLSEEEAGGFLIAAKGDRYELLFRLALSSGMRPEEYLGLQWKDVDWDRGAIMVQRVLVWRHGGGWKFEEPKTAKSRRLIPLPKAVLAELKSHRQAQLEERMKAGSMWEENGLIFTTETGTPIYPNNLRTRHFKPILERAGLPKEIRLYDLRHTMATLLLAKGEHPKIVSERLGHSSITLTLDVYSHVLPDMQKGAVEKLEGLFSNDFRTPFAH